MSPPTPDVFGLPASSSLAGVGHQPRLKLAGHIRSMWLSTGGGRGERQKSRAPSSWTSFQAGQVHEDQLPSRAPPLGDQALLVDFLLPVFHRRLEALLLFDLSLEDVQRPLSRVWIQLSLSDIKPTIECKKTPRGPGPPGAGTGPGHHRRSAHHQ